MLENKLIADYFQLCCHYTNNRLDKHISYLYVFYIVDFLSCRTSHPLPRSSYIYSRFLRHQCAFVVYLNTPRLSGPNFIIHDILHPVKEFRNRQLSLHISWIIYYYFKVRGGSIKTVRPMRDWPTVSAVTGRSCNHKTMQTVKNHWLSNYTT